MQKMLKFFHVLGAIGMAGGLAAYLMMLETSPGGATTLDYFELRTSLAFVAKWLLLPSMLIAVCSGILAMVVNPRYMEARWAWLKAVTGLAFFEATLASVDAPAQRAVKAMEKAAAGDIDPQELARLVSGEWNALWILLALSLANVALGVWRPRLRRRTSS